MNFSQPKYGNCSWKYLRSRSKDNFMNKSLVALFGLFVILILAGAGIYYFTRQNVLAPAASPENNVVENINNKDEILPDDSGSKPADTKENDQNIPENGGELSFVALTQQAQPPFIDNLKNAQDVKIDLNYDGDYSEENPPYVEPDYYTIQETGKKFVSLSKLKDRTGQYAYGPEYQSVFSSEGSHWYGGAPIYLSNSNSKYSVAYVGLKINDKDLISEMKVEFGIDFMSIDMGQSKTPFFASLLGIDPVYACGPGLYLRQVGESRLVFVEESGGISWYRLENPVKLYGLHLSYCDQDCSSKPAYCNNMSDDPAECDKYGCCFFNASVDDLAGGNLRMHILYKPNDKVGFLKLQMANLILADQSGVNYQPAMAKYFDHYYRAYLH